MPIIILITTTIIIILMRTTILIPWTIIVIQTIVGVLSEAPVKKHPVQTI